VVKGIAKHRLNRRLDISLGNLKENFLDTFVYSFPVWNVICFFRKIGRFIGKMPAYLKLLWRDEDWDYSFLLDMMRLKLTRMKKEHEEDEIHAGNLKRAREIAIIIGHLDRYTDIYKYTNSEDYDIWFEKCEDHEGFSTLKSNRSKRGDFLAERQRKLEEWHYNEFFRKLQKQLTRFWC
jgi:hypothetical protein